GGCCRTPPPGRAGSPPGWWAVPPPAPARPPPTPTRRRRRWGRREPSFSGPLRALLEHETLGVVPRRPGDGARPRRLHPHDRDPRRGGDHRAGALPPPARGAARRRDPQPAAGAV